MHELRHLDLNLLKTLDALLDERSVTRAAERLALTQPAVSAMLNRLRDSFGDPLFIRTARGITPTVRAEAMAVPVKALLRDIASLLAPPQFDPATTTMTLSLSATDYALRAIVQPFALRLQTEAPHLRLAVRTIDEAQAGSLLERGDIDIAIVTEPTVPPEMHTRQLYTERYVCALRAGHPDADKPLTLERFCALPHALVSLAGDPFSGVTDRALAVHGLERKVVLSLQSFLFLIAMLKQTDLMAVVPARLIVPGEGLIALEPPLEIAGFTKMMAWHARTHHHPGYQWLRRVLAEVCAVQAEE